MGGYSGRGAPSAIEIKAEETLCRDPSGDNDIDFWRARAKFFAEEILRSSSRAGDADVDAGGDEIERRRELRSSERDSDAATYELLDAITNLADKNGGEFVKMDGYDRVSFAVHRHPLAHVNVKDRAPRPSTRITETVAAAQMPDTARSGAGAGVQSPGRSNYEAGEPLPQKSPNATSEHAARPTTAARDDFKCCGRPVDCVWDGSNKGLPCERSTGGTRIEGLLEAAAVADQRVKEIVADRDYNRGAQNEALFLANSFRARSQRTDLPTPPSAIERSTK